MKTRERGMPEESMWHEFFDPDAILKKLVTSACKNVVDFGGGYGTFTIPAAHIVSGVVYALDIELAILAVPIAFEAVESLVKKEQPSPAAIRIGFFGRRIGWPARLAGGKAGTCSGVAQAASWPVDQSCSNISHFPCRATPGVAFRLVFARVRTYTEGQFG